MKYMNSKFKDIRIIIFNNLHYLILLFVLLAPIKAYLGKKVIILAFFLWIISVNHKDILFAFKNSKTLQFLFLFSFYIVLSLLWTINIDVGLKWLEINFLYFFIPILVIVTIREKLTSSNIIFIFIFAMLINEIISYGIFFNLIDNILGFKVTGNSSNPIPFQPTHITYSVYIAFTILLSFYKFFHIKRTNIYFNIATVFFLITMIFNLFLSSGRTGQLAIIFTILSLLMIYQRTNIRNIINSIIVLIFTLSIALMFSDTFKKRVTKGAEDLNKIYINNNFNTSFGVRIGSYIILPELLNDTNIVLGTGAGDIQDYVLEKTKKVFGENSIFSKQKGYLHSTFLEILITYGVLGFLIFILIFYHLFKIQLYNKELIFIRYILVFFILYSGLSVNMLMFKELMFLYSIFISILIKEEIDNKYKLSK
jgi:O-antigen ligase